MPECPHNIKMWFITTYISCAVVFPSKIKVSSQGFDKVEGFVYCWHIAN